MEAILGVTSKLAAPFDLMTMLGEVVNAAKQVLQAERGSVWLYDRRHRRAGARGRDRHRPMRVPAGAGLAGACARTRRIINVPDCYADPRFDPGVDKALGLPHALHADAAADRPQGRAGGRDAGAEQDGRRLRRGRRGARDGAGRAMRGRAAARADDGGADRRREDAAGARDGARSADEHAAVDDAGDSRATTSAARSGRRASPAATRSTCRCIDQGCWSCWPMPPVTASRRRCRSRRCRRCCAWRSGWAPTWRRAFIEVNNRLAETLADDRFITAFVGVLDPATHRLRFHSGGQAPILHYRAADRRVRALHPTSFPLGAMPLAELRPAVTSSSCRATSWSSSPTASTSTTTPTASSSASSGSRTSSRPTATKPMAELLGHPARRRSHAFARGAPQEDDMTAVLVKREAAAGASTDLPPQLRRAARDRSRSPRDVLRAARDRPRTPADVDFALEELFTNMVKYSPGERRPTCSID